MESIDVQLMIATAKNARDIKEKYYSLITYMPHLMRVYNISYKELSKHVGISISTFNNRLNNPQNWTSDDVSKAYELINKLIKEGEKKNSPS